MSAETYADGAEVQTLAGAPMRFRADVAIDLRIARVSEAQHGPVSLSQLASCGLSARAARGRIRSGRLHRCHRGVYVPGRDGLSPIGAVVAALLACGAGAVASHRTAAWLHSLRPDARRTVDVSAPAARLGSAHSRVIVHSAASLRPPDVTVVDDIPVTSVARTVLDCTPRLGRRGAEKLCREAVLHQTFDLHEFRSLLGHVRGHQGHARLSAALRDLATAKGQTHSPPEDILLAALRAADVPEPECNAPIQRPDGTWAYADFLWRDAHLIAEADPRGTHDKTVAYRTDRRRDRQLLRLGLQTLRFSDEDMEDPAACAREVGDFLHGLRRNVP